MIVYTLRRKGKFLANLYENQLYYNEFTSDSIHFLSPEDADKFVEENGLSNHEIVPISVYSGDYSGLFVYDKEGTRAWVKGKFYIHPDEQI